MTKEVVGGGKSTQKGWNETGGGKTMENNVLAIRYIIGKLPLN